MFTIHDYMYFTGALCCSCSIIINSSAVLNNGQAKLVGPAPWRLLDWFIRNTDVEITSCQQTSTPEQSGSSMLEEVSQQENDVRHHQ